MSEPRLSDFKKALVGAAERLTKISQEIDEINKTIPGGMKIKIELTLVFPDDDAPQPPEQEGR